MRGSGLDREYSESEHFNLSSVYKCGAKFYSNLKVVIIIHKSRSDPAVAVQVYFHLAQV